MTQTSPWAMAIFLLAALIGAIGQYLYKAGADAATGTIASYLLNLKLWLGVVCYVAVMVLFVAGFRAGGSIATLYPLYATTFIWAQLIATRTEGVPITATNVLGMVVLVAGMYLMGRKP